MSPMISNEAPSLVFHANQWDMATVKRLNILPGVLLIDIFTGERDFSQFGTLAKEYEERWAVYDLMPKKCACVNCQFNTVPDNPILAEGANWISALYNKIRWALRDVDFSKTNPKGDQG